MDLGDLLRKGELIPRNLLTETCNPDTPAIKNLQRLREIAIRPLPIDPNNGRRPDFGDDDEEDDKEAGSEHDLRLQL